MRLLELLYKSRRIMRQVQSQGMETYLGPYIRTALLIARVKELTKADPLTCEQDLFDCILRRMTIDSQQIKRDTRRDDGKPQDH